MSAGTRRCIVGIGLAVALSLAPGGRATGLTLIYGVMKILNIAHGSLYALGAYLSASLVGWWPAGLPGAVSALWQVAQLRAMTAA